MTIFLIIALAICLLNWIVWKSVAFVCIELLKENGVSPINENELDKRMGAAVLRAVTEFRLFWKKA